MRKIELAAGIADRKEELKRLAALAIRAARFRHHSLGPWKRKTLQNGIAVSSSACTKCGLLAQICPYPQEGGIEIGGLALISNCTPEKD